MIRSPGWTRFALRGAFAAAVAPGILFAQDRAKLLLPVPTSLGSVGTTVIGRAQPGVTTSSPLAFGPSFGDMFVGASYQAEARYTDAEDGTASVGMGFLNPVDMVGIEVVLTSLSTVRGGFGKRMAAGIKVHKLLPGNLAIAGGVEGLKVRGFTDSEESWYGAVSKYLVVHSGKYFNAVTLNAGVGNGRFQSEDDLFAGKDGINVFASGGIRVMQYLGAIADWTGQDLNIGASLALPIERFSLIVTPALADVTETAGDGARFIAGFGLTWRF